MWSSAVGDGTGALARLTAATLVAVDLRPATDTDVEAIATIVVECDRTFIEFAPAGWQPPSYERELEQARTAMATPRRWIAVAEADGEVVGYAAFVAADATGMPAGDNTLAHLGRLFVRPAHWGTGVAGALLDAATAEAAARGFTRMRLFTPRCHARARRFYEREGWQAVAEMPESPLGLPLTEYRRDL
jgi:GNAT superfamily N-acetyltransferase